MDPRIGKGLLLGLALAAGSAGCSNKSKTNASTPADGAGSVELRLRIESGVAVKGLTWTIANPALMAAPRSGAVDGPTSRGTPFSVSGLPAGNGYTIALKGTTEGPNPVDCVGTARFGVTVHSTTPAMVALVCKKPRRVAERDNTKDNTAAKNGPADTPACPAVTSLTATPSATAVGSSLLLSATGVDGNGGSSVNFAWTVRGGRGSGWFDSAKSSSPSFTCSSPGPVAVSVTVSGAGADSCTDSEASIDLECDFGDAGLPPLDAAPPSDDASNTQDGEGPDAASPDSGGDGGSPCLANNRGEDCTDTERLFVEKSVDCYNCLINGECLDDAVNNNKNKECGDLEGSAMAGALKGSPKRELCLSTIECILHSHCAARDVSICYCGSLGAGMDCIEATRGADGPCLQAEVDGVDRLKTDPPSEVFHGLADISTAAGKANQIFVCARHNSCDAVCSR